MKAENHKIDLLNQIYAQYTEQNKDNLLKTAESLLEIQKEGCIFVNAPLRFVPLGGKK